ncbi:MAG: phage holin family protein [Burkholderiales bacterium]
MEATAPRVDPSYERSRDARRERQPLGDNRSLIALFSDLFRETSTLVHQEAQLAKAEMSEKVSALGKGIAAIAIGGAIIFAGFIVLLFAASNGLAMFLPEEHAMWLAPLIVGLAVIVLGFIALAMGKHELSASNLQPSRTVESLRRDTELVKEHVS